jgi:transposase
VVGVLSAEGLITMERVTLDGTKIKANASGNTFRRKEKIEAHAANSNIACSKSIYGTN